MNLPILDDPDQYITAIIMYGKVCSVHVKIEYEILKEIEVTLLSGVKFIHAADLHLDSPFSGLKDMPSSILKELRESPFKAFQTIINEAISRQVDFIVLSGDLFDGENRSLRTQVRFRSEMEKLQQHQIPAYIIHGNHDHLSGSWITVGLPDNVHVFSGQTEVKLISKNRWDDCPPLWIQLSTPSCKGENDRNLHKS